MKNNLKRYTDFIKESVNISQIIIERDRFADVIREDLDDEMIVGARSYSDVCKKNGDPDEDFSEMQNFMDSKGFTIEKIKELFSNENNQQIGLSIVDTYNKLDSISATVDVYFYKLFEKLGLDNNIVSLGGSGWCDWNIGEEDEAFIRYRYGYHTTKYGQLMIKQSGMTEEEFKDDALSYLQEYIKWNFDSLISKAFEIKSKSRLYNFVNSDIIRQINVVDYSIIEEDRYIIDLIHLCEDINNLSTKDGDKLGNKFKIDPEDLATSFARDLEDLKIEIIFTGNDLVIYSKFKEDYDN